MNDCLDQLSRFVLGSGDAFLSLNCHVVLEIKILFFLQAAQEAIQGLNPVTVIMV
jgi:hypothetical protein